MVCLVVRRMGEAQHRGRLTAATGISRVRTPVVLGADHVDSVRPALCRTYVGEKSIWTL